MYVYEHKQVGKPLLWALSLPFAVAAGALYRDKGPLPALAIAGLGALLAISFSSLTVRVSAAAVSIKFGPGVFQKSFPVGDVYSAQAVHNPWWYGLGIHRTRDGWLYNVGGSDAVELHLEGDRRARIGTDEPERLLAAIRQVTASRG